MKHDKHSPLISVQPPTFTNAAHEARLLEQLRNAYADNAVAAAAAPRRRPLTLATAAVAFLLIAGAFLIHTWLAPNSVWAESKKALDGATTFVMREIWYGRDDKAHETTFYFDAIRGSAVYTPRETIWHTGDTICRYAHGELPNGVIEERVTITHGAYVRPVAQILSDSRLLAGFGQEQDLGLKEYEGRTLRLIEISDLDDPTERVEIFLSPETLLPQRMLRYTRDSAEEEWRLTRDAAFSYDETIDDSVFEPDYPATATVEETQLVTQTANASVDLSWQTRAAGIAWQGDKYIAIEDVWLGPHGWVGVKFRTNLHLLFDCPVGLAEDEGFRARWGLERFDFMRLVQGTQIVCETGAEYLSRNGAMHSVNGDGSRGYSYYYDAPDGLDPLDPQMPAMLTFRTIAVARDKGRGESMDHFWDWKENPEQWKLFEITVPAPEPSHTPPPSFNEKDLEWKDHVEVQQLAMERWLLAMGNAGRAEEAYANLKGKPLEDMLAYRGGWIHCLRSLDRLEEACTLYRDAKPEQTFPFGLEWLRALVELGKLAEAQRYFEQYAKLCRERYGNAEGIIAEAREILNRK